MTTPFLAEIQVFGFNFPPLNWAQCNGALLSIQQNSALFSLIGTYYGGNGTTNFQLPNLAGNAACGQGQGPGLSSRSIGEQFGVDSVTLTTSEMAAHTHGFAVFNQSDTAKRTNIPAPGYGLLVPFQADPYPAANSAANTSFNANMLGPAGQGLPHENRQPALALNYCIALSGVFPSFG
jgi:microcystin-dependent protein